jgi:hypothetical protein
MNLPLAVFETVIFLKNTGSGISRLLERKLRCAVYLILASDTSSGSLRNITVFAGAAIRRPYDNECMPLFGFW